MKNDILKLIKTRRTIRKFRQIPIRPEVLDIIIEMGQYAPSGVNSQPWHFTVIQDRTLIDTMNNDMKEIVLTEGSMADYPADVVSILKKVAVMPRYHFFYGAPVLILVSGEDHIQTTVSDIALASGNIMLAAHALGLGSCWINSAELLFRGEKADEYRKRFKIPHGFTPSHAIILGEPDGGCPKAAARRENTFTYI